LDDLKLMSIENDYLEYLKIYIVNKHTDNQIFRTFVDNWFAYNYKGPFLNSRGNPKWFKKPNPAKEKTALTQLHFVSNDAMKIINEEQEGDLIKDHTVPLKRLRTILAEELTTKSNLSDIKRLLERYYRLGVITKEENEHLNHNHLKDDMPENWDGKYMFARYDVVNIMGSISINI